MKRFSMVCLVLLVFALPLAGQPKFGVTSTAAPGTDFTKLKTYVWQSGWDANDKNIHATIVGAIDKEMTALGFEKKPAAPSDVIVKYAALRRIDVQPSSKAVGADAPRTQIDVGSLLILFLDPATSKELWRVRIDTPIEVDAAKIAGTINTAVTSMFAQYPTRIKK
jgi:hypothetical protein